MTSTDASIVPEHENSLNDDDFMKEIMDALEDAEVVETVKHVKKEKDHVMLYHDMIRRAMVDWGDDIINVLVAKFAKIPKVVAHIEAVRKDIIDPLRKHLE
jgi:hypothetical protein